MKKFLIKYFSYFILFISISILIHTTYKSEILHEGKLSYYSIYYIISFILILFSILTFFLSKKIKEYVIILTFSSLIGVYSFEIYLINLKKSLNKERIYFKETQKKFDTRSRIEIFEDLKKIDKEITVKISPKNFIKSKSKIFPLSGVSNSKTIYCNENGYYFIYNSDRYGFNNPDEEWDKKEIEYLLIGDSFAHGACVNRPDDIASILRKLTQKSVLNLGYSGNGPLIEFATLREYFKKNIRKVLWIYYESNDLFELNNEIKNKILNNYLYDSNFSQKLTNKQDDIDNITKKKIEEKFFEEKKRIKNQTIVKNNNYFRYFISFFKLERLRIKLINEKKIKLIHKEEVEVNKFRKILELTKNLTIDNNSKLFFIYLPDYSRYANNVSYKNPNYLKIKKIIQELDIDFIDIHEEVFMNEKNPLELFPFGQKGHFNVIGYNKITNVILNKTGNWILKNKFFD